MPAAWHGLSSAVPTLARAIAQGAIQELGYEEEKD
jgi:hypothetical protein